MDIERFVRERDPGWRRFARLLDTAEASPEWELGHERIRELVAGYRQICSDLNQARSYTANPDLLERLNQLAGRGYRLVYRGAAREAWLPAVRAFLLVEVPSVFRRRHDVVLAAGLAMLAGALVGFFGVWFRPSNAEVLVPRAFFVESPKERVESIEAGPERISTYEQAGEFGAFLMTHNIQVAFLAFSLGALGLAGGGALLFYNGLILGAVVAQYMLDDVGTFLVAWVGPHGVVEIPAILFSGAAGLHVGLALVAPGDRTRAAALRRAWPDAGRMLLASALLLVVAGTIEGSFSQFSAKTLPYGVKIGLAGVLFTALVAYLFLPLGRFAREPVR